MKTTLKFGLFALFSICMLTSCEKENYEVDPIVCDRNELDFNSLIQYNEKIVFDNTKDFLDVFSKLSIMEYEEQMLWADSNNLTCPLYKEIENCNDEIMVEMPRAFQLLFNKNMEVQIGDTLVVFDKGNLYIKSIGLQTLPSLTLLGTVDVNNMQEKTATRYSYATPYGKLGACFQYEFTIPNNGSKFKYVHELKSVIVHILDPNLGGYEISQLFLFVKLEYKGSKWRVAGEERNILINLNVCRRDLSRINYNYEVLIDTQRKHNFSYHSIDITGDITHTIIGVPGSKKINQWNNVLSNWE